MKHEGLRLQAYRCPAGIWTVGYGHTAGVRRGQTVSREEAIALLESDVRSLSNKLADLQRGAGINLSPNREAALVSFAFNVGFGALCRSTLWRKVVANQDDPSIALEFARWKFADGRVMPGLVKRRADEAALYFAQ